MYSHILAQVVPDHEGRGEAAVSAAEALLDDDGRITILHVEERMPSFVSSYIPDDVVDHVRAETRQALSELAMRSSATTDVALARGQPARTISEHAKAHHVDCIVIASHHPGLSDFLLGSTAAWVARHADCSVHIVR